MTAKKNQLLLKFISKNLSWGIFSQTMQKIYEKDSQNEETGVLTLFKKGITEYNLIFKQGFSANTIHRIKKGEAVSTKTLDALCYALDCEVSDIIKFEKE